MITLLAEIEMIINNRPLTFMYDELAEEPITPNHLIYSRMLKHTNSSKTPTTDTDIQETDFTVRTTYINQILENVWNTWTHEYLISLREYQSKVHKQSRNKIVAVNDTVVIIEGPAIEIIIVCRAPI